MRAVLWLAVSTVQQASEDKTSLVEQERAARDLCRRESWQVLDVLRVPGHSRHYIDIHEASADMLKSGIDAFERLMQHWQAQDFDVLVVRDGNRFARTQTLHTYVVEATIRAGARIYSLSDGWVDQQNFRMYAAMNGYMAASQMEHLQRQRDAALEHNARRGLPLEGQHSQFIRVVRDERGRAVGLEPNPATRRLLDDAADALLEGLGWFSISERLYELGHRTDSGTRYMQASVRRWFYTPAVWGHSARHYSANSSSARRWVYDDSVPPPDGVTLYRHTHAPAWDGDRAAAIRAELRRREQTRGSERPRQYAMFSRLIICAECGSYFTNRSRTGKRPWHGYGCGARANSRVATAPCSNRHYVSHAHVQQVVDGLLRQAIAAADVNTLLRPDTAGRDYGDMLRQLEADHSAAQRKLSNIVLQSAEAGPNLQAAYADAMHAVQAQIDALARQIGRAQAQISAADTTPQQQALMSLDLDQFWQRPPRECNIVLHRVFGLRRLVAHEGQITGLADDPNV